VLSVRATVGSELGVSGCSVVTRWMEVVVDLVVVATKCKAYYQVKR